MSNYSDSPNNCRVDFFKPSGKWYCTETVVFFDNNYKDHPISAFKAALKHHFKDQTRLSDMTAVCLEPYSENAFPLMVKVSDI